MSRILFALIGLIVAVSARPNAETLKTNVVLVDNVDEYIRKNPDVKLIALEKTVKLVGTQFKVDFTLGERVNGDTLVAQESSSKYDYQGIPTDVEFSSAYPTNGEVGANVSYVHIDVGQSTNLADAYVASGGIGEQTITIVFGARVTKWYEYTVEIYGN